VNSTSRFPILGPTLGPVSKACAPMGLARHHDGHELYIYIAYFSSVSSCGELVGC
jgi:hypothetical protein